MIRKSSFIKSLFVVFVSVAILLVVFYKTYDFRNEPKKIEQIIVDGISIDIIYPSFFEIIDKNHKKSSKGDMIIYYINNYDKNFTDGIDYSKMPTSVKIVASNNKKVIDSFKKMYLDNVNRIEIIRENADKSDVIQKIYYSKNNYVIFREATVKKWTIFFIFSCFDSNIDNDFINEKVEIIKDSKINDSF